MSPTHSHAPGNIVNVSSDGSYEEFSLEDTPPSDTGETPITVGGHDVNCPSCGASNPESNRHCQECGARLSQAPLPTAPRPAVQATAGVRAALAISGLLFVVIVVALLFNVFSGDPAATDTTTPQVSTTLATVQEPAVIDILDVKCSHDGLGSLTCGNLLTDEGEYQVNWEEILDAEETMTIELIFRQPMTVTRIDWSGVEEPERFRQNYRARGLTLDADGSLAQIPIELKDTPGLQTVDFVALSTNGVLITIESAYQAEVTEGNVFRELAIDKIVIWGYPANPTSEEG
ncbi:MAG: zinc ribbon domain-containing protein [Actinomycetota bacterium]|nr:zinc ribbon domain-containing protein [Actinomycetota bacterium]